MSGIAWLGLWVSAAACGEPLPPDGSYYSERIDPILQSAGCATQVSGCHFAAVTGTAAGNLDLESYDSLMRRSDVLPAYGPYPVGLLLLKASESVIVNVETLDPPDPARPEVRTVEIHTDIRHAGGTNLLTGTPAYGRLREWIESGFRRTGVPVDEARENGGECVSELGHDAGFDPADPPSDAPSFDAFVRDVQPVLVERCAGSACHGAALADLHLTCGESEEERRWNFHIAVQHLAAPVERAELLRRPLALARGGAFHGGGGVFPTEEDEGYRAIEAWARDLVARRPELVTESVDEPGYRFFANRVQPMLVRKGCMNLNCHSPISVAFNLRGGSRGSFSRFARRQNYALARKMMAFEAIDPAESRLVAKNLLPPELGGQGMVHRGGSLFEDFGGERPSLEACASFDADSGDLNELPAYCVIARWHRIERDELIRRGEIFDDSELVRAVIWVARPIGAGAVTDFDAYRPGADLRRADARVAGGGLEIDPPVSLLAGCALPSDATDVRGPAVSWDGSRVAFAARTSAASPLRLYAMNEDGTDCGPIAGVAAPVDEENGILTHDFDPAFAPDGRIVFASTRGNLDRAAYDYQGPTRTPASMAPNANLYAIDADGSVRQLTFLLNQELNPAFMSDGRVIFTAEKREQGFHHLALRRENLDGGDFHPLYANRPSLGLSAATEVAQLLNQNFAFVAGEIGFPDGAGTVAIGNRSIGPDHADRALDHPGFLRGMSVPAPGLAGGLRGVYRSPAALPMGRLLVSCEPNADAMSGAGFDWDLCELDYRTGVTRPIGGEAGTAEVEAVAVFARTPRAVLVSDGRGVDHPELVPGARDAVVLFNDFPMIASLMFENTRTGRPVDRRVGGFDVVEAVPPPAFATSFADVPESVVIDEVGPMFVANRTLGHVPIYDDGSAHVRLPGGTPIRYRLTGADGAALEFLEGAAFTGTMIQREEEQYYPGERIQRSVPRRFFNALCGSCHGSITGRELDIAVNLDVVSSASINEARDSAPTDLYSVPSERPPATER